MKQMPILVVAALTATVGGCIHLTTENEVKPIHITMDVNLKVDKGLDKAFADETTNRPQGDFRKMKELLDRGAVGIDNQAMFVARETASDDDRLFVIEQNARRLKRLREVARESGVSLAEVQRRHVEKMRQRVAVGSGHWVQNDQGVWEKK